MYVYIYIYKYMYTYICRYIIPIECSILPPCLLQKHILLNSPLRWQRTAAAPAVAGTAMRPGTAHGCRNEYGKVAILGRQRILGTLLDDKHRYINKQIDK